MKHLQGLKILVGQTAPAGQHFCHRLEALGADCFWLPSIEITVPPNPTLLKNQVKTLNEQDILIFLSAHAVTGVAPFWPLSVRDSGNPFKSLKKPKIIAIGQATKKALLDLNVNMGVSTPSISNSEGILAMPDLKDVRGFKITLVKGLGGRDLLEQSLLERGAKVSILTAYQRVKPSIALERYESLMQNNGIDAMVCGSFESVKNFTELFKTYASFRTIPLVVASERVRTLAQNLGFQTIWVAADASHEALLSILLQKREMIWRKKS